MFALSLSFPVIDPVLIEIGPVVIRWYALAYIAGITGGYLLLRLLAGREQPRWLSLKQLDDLMFWAVIGIMLGGRFGYVLFYKPDYYLANPAEMIAIWKGGMSFHGGLLGVIAAFYLYAKKHGLNYLRLMDHVALVAPLGLLFGRLANFINGELYGRVTDHPFGIIFPHAGAEPRHPSQLYEAALEGLLLLVVLWLVYFCTSLREKTGALAGLFLLGYASARAFVEQFRMPDAHLGFIAGPLTMGQLLCLPMALVGVYLIIRAHRKEVKA